MSFNSTHVWEIRTTGSETNGGGFDSAASGTDLSQSDTASATPTDVISNGTTTLTSTTGFCALGAQATLPGNTIHLYTSAGPSTAAHIGFYRIVSASSNLSIVVDVTVAAGTSRKAYVGGAFKLGTTLDAEFFAVGVAGNTWWIKNGTYSLGEAVTLVGAGSAVIAPIVKGYNGARTNPIPTGANRPLINTSFSFTLVTYARLEHLQIVATTAVGVSSSAAGGTYLRNCYFAQLTSSTYAVSLAGASANPIRVIGCEFYAPDAYGLNLSGPTNTTILGCYFGLNGTGITLGAASSGFNIVGCVFYANNAGMSIGSNAGFIIGCTFYANNTAIAAAALTQTVIFNNIIAHSATIGISCSAFGNSISDFNLYHGNTSDVSVQITKGPNDITDNANEPLLNSPPDFRITNSSPAANKAFDAGKFIIAVAGGGTFQV